MNSTALCKRYISLSDADQLAVSFAVHSAGGKKRADLAPGSELGERAFELVELLLHGIDPAAVFPALERGDAAVLEGVRAKLALLFFFRGADTRFAALVKEQLPLWQAARRLAGAPTLAVGPAPGVAFPCGSLGELAAGLNLACAFCAAELSRFEGERPVSDTSCVVEATTVDAIVSFGCCQACDVRLVLCGRSGHRDHPVRGELFGVGRRPRARFGLFELGALFGNLAPALRPADGPSVKHVFLSKSPAYIAECERLAEAGAATHLARALKWQAAVEDVLDAVSPGYPLDSVREKLDRRLAGNQRAARQALLNGGSQRLAESLNASAALGSLGEKVFPLLAGYPGQCVASRLALRFYETEGDVEPATLAELRQAAKTYAACREHGAELRQLASLLVARLPEVAGPARASRGLCSHVADWTKPNKNPDFAAEADALFGGEFEVRIRETCWYYRQQSPQPRKLDSQESFAGVLVVEARRRGCGVSTACLVCPVPEGHATAELDRIAKALGALSDLRETLEGLVSIGQTAEGGARCITPDIGAKIKENMRLAEKNAAYEVGRLLGPPNALGWHDSFGSDAWLSFLGATLRNHRLSALHELAKAFKNKRVTETPTGQLPKHSLTMLRFGEPVEKALSGW